MNLSILKTVGFGVGALLGVTVVFYASRAGYRRWFSKLDVVGRNQISENKKKFTAAIKAVRAKSREDRREAVKCLQIRHQKADEKVLRAYGLSHVIDATVSEPPASKRRPRKPTKAVA